MIFTTINENGEVVFNENTDEAPVRCPECSSIDTSKEGIAYRCSHCKTKFMPNDKNDDE